MFSQFYYSYSFFVLSFLCGIYFLCFYCDFFLELVLEFSLLVGSQLLEIFHLLFTEFPLLRGLLTFSCLEDLSDWRKLRLIFFYLYFLLCDKIYANFLRFIYFFLFSSLIIFKFKCTVLVLKSFVAIVSSSSISFFGSGSSPPNSSSLVESSSFNIYYNAISFSISSFSFFLRQWIISPI